MTSNWFTEFRDVVGEYLIQNRKAGFESWSDGDLWNSLMTKACKNAADLICQPLVFAARGFCDGFKSEYLSIDCTIHNGTWGLPELMIELENNVGMLRYSAWKLLCTRAKRRLLIGYYDDLKKTQEEICDVSRQTNCGEQLCVLLAQRANPALTAEQ